MAGLKTRQTNPGCRGASGDMCVGRTSPAIIKSRDLSWLSTIDPFPQSRSLPLPSDTSQSMFSHIDIQRARKGGSFACYLCVLHISTLLPNTSTTVPTVFAPHSTLGPCSLLTISLLHRPMCCQGSRPPHQQCRCQKQTGSNHPPPGDKCGKRHALAHQRHTPQ